MATAATRRTFRDRNEPHTIIFARGDRVRHFTMSRTSISLATLAALGVCCAIFAAPALFLFNTETDGAPSDLEWRLAQNYEQRISDLRAQLDRATSKRFLSEKMVETKVDVLLEQQEELAARYEKLGPLLDQARDTGLIATVVPTPIPRPTLASLNHEPAAPAPDGSARSDADTISAYAPSRPNGSAAAQAIDLMSTGGIDAFELRSDAGSASEGLQQVASLDDKPAVVDALSALARNLDEVEWQQITGLKSLAHAAREQAIKIATALDTVGISVPVTDEETARGGPYKSPESDDYSFSTTAFDSSYTELETALTKLGEARRVADTLPVTEPMPARNISSRFGVRADPFLSRRAMHTGIDYAMPAGTAIRAQANGVVTHAGGNGGYGNMVEIDHGNGIVARFAHMARITVKVGQTVETGEVLGTVGSTGRSTGPHLHYEIRANDRAIDPSRLYRIGEKLGDMT